MKTTRFFAALCSLGAVLALSASCQKEPVAAPEEASGANLKTVTLTVGLPEDTKINSNSKTPTQIQWNSSTEEIGVIAKVGDEVKYYTFSGTAGAVSPTLEVSCSSVDDGAQLLYAVYPSNSYDHTNNSWDGVSESIPLILPYQQGSASIGISNKALLSSKITGTSISLKHVCGYLKINAPKRFERWTKSDGSTKVASTDLKKIIISSTSALAGKVGVSFNADGTIKAVDASAADKKSIEYSPKRNTTQTYTLDGTAEDKSDNGSAWSVGIAYVPVLPGTYNDLDFKLKYRPDINGNAVDEYTAHSSGTNTFTPGVALGGADGIVLSGPFVERIATTAVTKSSTTLSMAGNATIWTYSGVTVSDYTFKFCYREAGSGDWTEVDAVYTAGDVTASATVDAAKTYEAKLKITACGVTYESAVKAEVLISSVTFDFGATPDYGTFTYLAAGESEADYHMCVDADDNPMFPTHSPGAKDGQSFKAQVWNGTAFGPTQTIDISLNAPAKTLGVTLVKDGCTVVFEHNQYYYTYYGKILCPSKQYIRLVCPAGKTITKVVAEVEAATNATNRDMTAGIGTAKGNRTKVEETTVTAYGATSSNPEKGLNKSITMVIPGAAANTDYWLYVSGRCSRFTIYYESSL